VLGDHVWDRYRARARRQPNRIPGLVGWWRADRGITLAAALDGAGTSPPAVTLSGSLAQALAVRVEVQTTGARGASTFRWSVDGGASFVASGVSTAASVALGSTGINALFPAGTYTNDNVFRAQVTTWADLSGGAMLTQAAGIPLLATPGRITFTTPRGFVYTGPQVFEPNATVAFVAKRSNIVANYQPLGSFSPVGPHGLYIYVGSNAGSNTQWGTFYGASVDSGFQLDVPKVAIMRPNAPGDVDFRTNGVASKGTTGLSVYSGGGAIGDTGGTQNMEGDLFEIALYNRRLADIECSRLEACMARRNFS
jgi:hypothetical protein